jgi:hypothetical protein
MRVWELEAANTRVTEMVVATNMGDGGDGYFFFFGSICIKFIFSQKYLSKKLKQDINEQNKMSGSNVSSLKVGYFK